MAFVPYCGEHSDTFGGGSGRGAINFKCCAHCITSRVSDFAIFKF